MFALNVILISVLSIILIAITIGIVFNVMDILGEGRTEDLVSVNALDNKLCFLSILKHSGWNLHKGEKNTIYIKRKEAGEDKDSFTEVFHAIRFKDRGKAIQIGTYKKLHKNGVLVSTEREGSTHISTTFNIVFDRISKKASFRYFDNEIELAPSVDVGVIIGRYNVGVGASF